MDREGLTLRCHPRHLLEVDEVTATPDSSITPKVPISEPGLSVTVVQLLINLEEKPELAANRTIVFVSRLVFLVTCSFPFSCTTLSGRTYIYVFFFNIFTFLYFSTS